MSKINQSDSNGVYYFSFSLRDTNPFEKVILGKLRRLIENGCSKKEAIMTLMCANMNMINNNILDAAILESLQFQETKVEKEKSITDKNILMTDNVKVTADKKREVVNKEISQNQQSKVENEQKQVSNEIVKRLSNNKHNTFDKQEKLQNLLKSIYT